MECALFQLHQIELCLIPISQNEMGLGNFLDSPQKRSYLDGFWERVTLKEVSFLEVDMNAGDAVSGDLGKQANFWK